MNIHQFQYVLAVAESRHFETAADKCFVTQSTLSTMISKLEDEIGIKIFDRKKKPVELTTEGLLIVEQLKTITRDIDRLGELVDEIKGEVKGQLTIAVIPTVAPFLLPLFLQDFAARYRDLNIVVKEETTAEIVKQLRARELDIGIISTPVFDKDLLEYELYKEPFVFYDASGKQKRSVSVSKIRADKLFLLEEGHCMRTQVIKLCEHHKRDITRSLNFEYKAGSIDSLLRFVKANEASTLLPYLSTVDFGEQEKARTSIFSSPVPYRSIGLVTHRHFVKKKMLEQLQAIIVARTSQMLPNTGRGEQLLPV